MPMLKYTLIICLIIFQFTIAGCARKKPASQDCAAQIKNAETTLHDKADSLDKTRSTAITNLITAAKIHQQHNEEMLCVDKIHRALTLLKETSTEEKKK